MTSSGVTPGSCGLKFSTYMIGELVTTTIYDVGAMVTKTISSRIKAHANRLICDFPLRHTCDLAYKKHVGRTFQ